MSAWLSLSHFTDEETEAQRGDGAGLKSLRACGRVEARALQGGLSVSAAHAGHESARVLVRRDPSGLKSPPLPSGFVETILSPVRAGEALWHHLRQVCVALRGNRPRAGREMCSGAGGPVPSCWSDRGTVTLQGSGWGSSLPRALETFPRRPPCLLGPGRGGVLPGSPITMPGLRSSPGITVPLAGPGVGRGPSQLPSPIFPICQMGAMPRCLGGLS